MRDEFKTMTSDSECERILQKVAEQAVGPIEDFEPRATAFKSAEMMRNEAKEELMKAIRMEDFQKNLHKGLSLIVKLMGERVSKEALDQFLTEVEQGMKLAAETPPEISEGEPIILQELFGISDESMLRVYDLASQLVDEKEFQDAREIFSFSCIYAPDISAHWCALALCYQQTGASFNEICEIYEMAVGVAPEDPEPLIRQAAFFVEHNYGSEARQALDKAENLLSIGEEHASWRSTIGSLRSKLA